MDIPEQYLARIHALYPDLTISSLHVDSDGLINNVYIINNELVFRFPKNEEAQKSLAVEIKVLDLARNHLDITIPFFEHREPDFVVYRMIAGEPLYRNDILRLDETIQDRLAEQLAIFLRQLHTIPINEFDSLAIPKSDPAQKLARCNRLYQDIEQELFPYLMTMAKDSVRQLFEPLFTGKLSLDFLPTLTHNDLAPYHILYNRNEQRITGIIDFGTAGINDPASDFGLILNAYGEGFLRRMTRFYPKIDEALNRARFYAGALELEWALTGVRTRDLTWQVCHLGWARDVMPIGYKLTK
jgi:aminoglycoside 2''-phosphotransferase